MIKTFQIKNKIIGFDIPKICVPIVETTKEDILEQAHIIANASKTKAIDIVEFRADFYEDLGDAERLEELLKELLLIFTDLILLFTIRSENEGGNKIGNIDINRINEYVIENKLSDMVDLELYSGAEDVERLTELASKKGVKIIISNHDFESTPDVSEMIKRLRFMQDIGADVAKLAVMPKDKIQVLSLLAATTAMNEKYADIPIVTIAMESLGAISRISGQIFGSAITFAALDRSSAPGQMSVDSVKQAMDIISTTC